LEFFSIVWVHVRYRLDVTGKEMVETVLEVV
jgi:hypothetical protein